MRVLVLGAGGMAGHMIALRLTELGNKVVGLARRKLDFCESITADVADTDKLKKIILNGNFDILVNAVGILQEGVNRDPVNGIGINSVFPHFLAKITSGIHTRVIHMSTDCVFGGHDGGGYKEDDLPTARDYYGRTKALGELNDDRNLTFRTSIVGPDMNTGGTGLFNWFMKQNGEVKGYTNAIWTGVTTLTFADAVYAAAKEEMTGLYHLVHHQSINKYELLKLFNSLRKDPVRIIPENDFNSDKSLVNTRTDFHFTVPDYPEMIGQMGKWISAHKELYRHYEQIWLGRKIL